MSIFHPAPLAFPEHVIRMERLMQEQDERRRELVRELSELLVGRDHESHDPRK